MVVMMTMTIMMMTTTMMMRVAPQGLHSLVTPRIMARHEGWPRGRHGDMKMLGAFAEMSEDVSRICGIIAHDLARTHVSYYNDDAKRTKGMYRQRTKKAWGHTAHRGWARLLLNHARDLITHGLAHRGANGAAMPKDEDDQDGHFFFNHPERGLPRCLGARSYCYCCSDPIPPTEGVGA